MAGPLQDSNSVAKLPRGVSLYSRYVNRPGGRYLASAAVRLGWSANQVTVLSALVTVGAVALLAIMPPSGPVGVSVAALLVLGFMLDSADGQVARMRGTSSPAGEWLDHVIDAGKMVAIHGAVAIAWFRHVEQPDAWLLLPLGYQFVAVVMFSALTIVTLLKSRVRDAVAGAPSQRRAVALLPADFGVLAWGFVLWGDPETFRTWYLCLAVLNGLILVAMLVKWFGELRALGSPGGWPVTSATDGPEPA